MAPIANASAGDASGANLTLVVIALLATAGVTVMAAVPVVTAARRGWAREGIAAAMLLWGVVAAVSVIMTVRAQMQYSREYTMRIMQNYDAADTSDRPRLPWLWWSGLGISWAIAITAVSRRKLVAAARLPDTDSAASTRPSERKI